MIPFVAFSQIVEKYPDQQPEKLDLYLVIGQSNMAGRASIETEDELAIEGAYVYSGDIDNPWSVATNPLNRHSTIRKVMSMQRLSPAYSFAKKIRKARPSAEIGLVMNARGGTKIVQWLPGTHYFQEAVKKAKAAMKYGTFKGIIWHQGESDSDALRTSMYLNRLEIMVNGFREALDDLNLPFVAGELAENKDGKVKFNKMLQVLPSFINQSGLASAKGTQLFDEHHFDSKSQRLLGERYADEMLKLLKED